MVKRAGRFLAAVLALSGIGWPASAAEAQSGAGPADTVPQSLAAAEFWRRLCDTTLDRLLEAALRANQDVQAAQARVRGARAARLSATLDLVPAVTAAGGVVRQRLPRAAFPVSSGTGPLADQTIWDAGFDASWELDVFGRLRHGLKASSAFVGAAQEDLREVQVALLAELARAYFELRGAQGLLVVARRNADNQRSSLEVTRQRLEAGRGTAFDTERAQAQLSFTLASIPSLEAEVAAAQYRIAVLVARQPGVLAAELGDNPELPVLPDIDVAGNQDSLIRARPDVAAAERRAAAEQALVWSAKAGYLPRFSIGASTGFAANTLDRFGKTGTFRYAVGPGISWPLLNLGRVKAGVDASRARADEVTARYTQARLLAREDLENARMRYRSARERVAHFEDAAASSRRAAELARLRFADGVADFLQVLDAERTQLDAESQLAQGRTAAATAYAALYKAVGGSWSPRP